MLIVDLLSISRPCGFVNRGGALPAAGGGPGGGLMTGGAAAGLPGAGVAGGGSGFEAEPG